MSDSPRQGAQKAKSGETSIALVVAIAALVAISAYFVFFSTAIPSVPGGPDSWGQFGDYFGGIINPVIGIATVILIVRTLRTTREEAADTRDQLRVQSDHLERQVKGFEKQQELAEIQRRLDGVLADWQARMSERCPRLQLADSDKRSFGIGDDGSTVGQILYSDDIWGKAERSAKLAMGRHCLRAWQESFPRLVWLTEEFAAYCREYERLSGNKKFTNYYRQRIQMPIRVLNATDCLKKETYESLTVGLYRPMSVG